MHRAMLLRKVAALPGPPMRCCHLHRVGYLNIPLLNSSLVVASSPLWQ
ncbi:unnamed protein product, partial [Brassica rapa]